MALLPLDLIWQRVEASRTVSTADLFNSLLALGEALLKTYTAAIVAGVPDEVNRHRYRLCHKLVRAAGIGEWDDVLADVATGPASQHLLSGAASIQTELTQRYARETWTYEATELLHTALAAMLPGIEPLPTRVDGRRWFSLFVQFRNKTKGHGAPTNETLDKIVQNLETSIRIYLNNSVISALPWAYVRRNLSGKYNVVGLCGKSAYFDKLKGDRTTTLQDGVYIDLGSLCKVELMETTFDVTEFYLPNGHFRQRTCEWLSYISGARRDLDSTLYLAPATALPPSSTEGAQALDMVGQCFANLPPAPSDYVSRDELETDLLCILSDDRHPVVTLVGRGGIGKTSLALHVLYRIAHTLDRFIGIIWLSARDIDLLPQGPKLVRPAALTSKDMAQQFASLFQPGGWDQKGFDAEKYLTENLRSSEIGPLLLVFDNFETVQQPIDVFNWLDTHIRSPNKILITSRHRDFKGAYDVEVSGMTEPQCSELVRKTGESLGVAKSITSQFVRDVYRESEGHPYVVKVLVGEAADGKNVRRIERIVASKEDLLDALFERTYARLSPAAKRVFLTLSNWRSLVAQPALDAAFLRPSQAERIDTLTAIDELRRVSFVDEHISPKDDSVFVSAPLVASVFGRRKLSVSPDRSAIEEDTRFLQRFGAMQLSDVQRGVGLRIQRFFGSLSDDLAQSKVDLASEMPVLELIARSYPSAWLMIADLWRESGDPAAPSQIIAALTRYLETTTRGMHQKIAWDRMAIIYRQQGNWAEFVNTQVHIAELPGAELSAVSSAVNTFNSVSANLDPDVRRGFAQRLATVMDPKIVTGDATDCSRLAWLLLRCDREERACEIVDRGLDLDPNNEHCQGLKVRIWQKRADTARLYANSAGLIEAAVNLAEVPGLAFEELSEAANTFNQQGRDLDINDDRRQYLAQRLVKVMEPRIGEGNATDCSRLAWVLIQVGENDRARRIIEQGLYQEPQNDHCLKLKARLGIPRVTN